MKEFKEQAEAMAHINSVGLFKFVSADRFNNIFYCTTKSLTAFVTRFPKSDTIYVRIQDSDGNEVTGEHNWNCASLTRNSDLCTCIKCGAEYTKYIFDGKAPPERGCEK